MMMDGRRIMAPKLLKAQMVPLLFLLLLYSGAVVQMVAALDCPAVCACEEDDGDLRADCSERNLTTIPTGFAENTIWLSMVGNNISTLTPDMFENLTQLKTLILSDCLIEDIANDTFLAMGATLETLRLERNLLTTIGAGMFTELILNRLSLEGNVKLSDISKEAFETCNIERLELSSCNLAELHKETLAPLKGSLQGLVLSNNAQKVVIPPRALEGFSLADVIMENSRLTSLEFLHGSSVRVLEVNKNADLGKGVLTVLQHVEGIEELYVSKTGITNIDIKLTANYSLYVLDVSYNDITTIDLTNFVFLPFLATLNVAGNRIESISKDLHSYLPSLAYLELSNNRLSQLEPDAFTKLPLKYLDVSNNRIQAIPESLKGLLVAIQTFKVEGNPLHCNCEILWFTKWVKGLSPVADKDIRVDDCATPKRVPLLSLRDIEFRCTAPIVLFVMPDSIEPGRKVSLYCKAAGDPPPTVTLYTKDTAADDGDKNNEQTKLLTMEPNANRTVQTTELVYHIDKFNCSKDFGDYQCSAMNVAGEVYEVLALNGTTIAEDSSCTPKPDPTKDPNLPATTPKTGASSGNDGDDDSTGYIVAIVVCVVLLFIALVIGAYCYWQKKTTQTYKLETHSNGDAKVAYTNEGAEVADTV